MSVKPTQSALVQLIQKQVPIRNTADENAYYQKQLRGAFEEDVRKVVQVLTENRSLVPALPAWSSLCVTFEKGRCSFGSSCHFAHGRVIQIAMRNFRKPMLRKPPQQLPVHVISLSASQSQRLLDQVHQATHQPLPSSSITATGAGSYGLQKMLPLHPYATADLDLLLREEPIQFLYRDDGAPILSGIELLGLNSPEYTPHHTQPSTPKGGPHQTPYLEPLDSPPLTPRSFSLDASSEHTPYGTRPTTPKASPHQTPDLTPPASPLSTPRSLPRASETPQTKKPTVFDPNNPFDLLGGDFDLESNES